MSDLKDKLKEERLKEVMCEQHEEYILHIKLLQKENEAKDRRIKELEIYQRAWTELQKRRGETKTVELTFDIR